MSHQCHTDVTPMSHRCHTDVSPMIANCEFVSRLRVRSPSTAVDVYVTRQGGSTDCGVTFVSRQTERLYADMVKRGFSGNEPEEVDEEQLDYDLDMD
eukprot:8328570-Pyramimonas_sp.AAC.2